VEGTEWWVSKLKWNRNYLNEINRKEGKNIPHRTVHSQNQENHKNRQTAKGIQYIGTTKYLHSAL
jgi:hypothetical protein